MVSKPGKDAARSLHPRRPRKDVVLDSDDEEVAENSNSDTVVLDEADKKPADITRGTTAEPESQELIQPQP
jgi:hypothetical protein